MRDDLRHDVLKRLEHDYGLKHRAGTDYMRGGTGAMFQTVVVLEAF